MSFFVAHFFAFYSIKHYFCQRKRSQGNEKKTQQSTKNHLPQTRQISWPKSKMQKKLEQQIREQSSINHFDDPKK